MKPGGPSSKRVDGPPPSGAPAARRQTFGRQVPERGGAGEIDVHGASSRRLTGEIGLFEFQIVFAEVFICPETMRLHLKSLRETHFEATVTRFEYSSEFGRESEVKRSINRFAFACTQSGLAIHMITLTSLACVSPLFLVVWDSPPFQPLVGFVNPGKPVSRDVRCPDFANPGKCVPRASRCPVFADAGNPVSRSVLFPGFANPGECVSRVSRFPVFANPGKWPQKSVGGARSAPSGILPSHLGARKDFAIFDFAIFDFSTFPFLPPPPLRKKRAPRDPISLAPREQLFWTF